MTPDAQRIRAAILLLELEDELPPDTRHLPHDERLELLAEWKRTTLKQRRRDLARELHPDRNDDPEAGPKLAAINDAYDLLVSIEPKRESPWGNPFKRYADNVSPAYDRPSSYRRTGPRPRSAYGEARASRTSSSSTSEDPDREGEFTADRMPNSRYWGL